MRTGIGKSRLARVAPLLALCLLGLVASPSAHAAGGSALGWGYNYSGQVGNGTKSPTGRFCVEIPTPVTGLSTVTQIRGGYEHGLALLDDGTVTAWGYNPKGQVGDGSTTDRTTPCPWPVSPTSSPSLPAAKAAWRCSPTAA